MSERDERLRIPEELAVVRHSSDIEFARVSPSCAQRIGFTSTELSARPLIEWIHEDDQSGLESVLATGEGRVRARHACKNGEWIALEWRVRTNSSGQAALGMLAAGARISGKDVAPDSFVMGANISETLAQMALIVEAKNPGMMCSILLVDEAGERVAVGAGPSLPKEYNDAVEGLQIGPAVGSCGTAAFWNVPVIVEDIAADPLWRDLRGAADIAGVAACWSHPIATTTGEVLGAMALYDTEPSSPSKRQLDGLEIAAQMVGLAIERDRLEEQLRHRAKMEAIGVLAGGIAHDFNNMLAAILGNAEVALETLSATAEAVPMLNEIQTASVRASELCGQLLAYAGLGALNAETVDCNAMVMEIGGLLRAALAKKAELVYELSPNPSCVEGDRTQLRQVVMNLITNASEAIGNNEGTIRIGTEVRRMTRKDLDSANAGAGLQPGEYVHLWVSDSGCGISTEARTNLFDPFFTTKDSGRGLGLAAVHGIVLRHGGTITFDSHAHTGTSFSLFLPQSTKASVAPSPAATVTPEGRGATILVIDDEPAVRGVLGRMLRVGGYEVLSAEDGPEGIELFRREANSIDCVLLDLSMPKLDGDEVFLELQNIRSDVRVVLTSGFAEEQVMDRFPDSGLAGLVKKPADLQTLLDAIEKALE